LTVGKAFAFRLAAYMDVSDFKRRRVLVLGDAILDEYLLGDCSRI
jgi:bifunctional ADP-heptose synthase (sugar kinase/adenylyltransferase)